MRAGESVGCFVFNFGCGCVLVFGTGAVGLFRGFV
jgi:hypothetical protein